VLPIFSARYTVPVKKRLVNIIDIIQYDGTDPKRRTLELQHRDGEQKQAGDDPSHAITFNRKRT
jgi:hypothetical protein